MDKGKMYNNYNSPVDSDPYIWIAEYSDNSYLSKYDFNTMEKHDFSEIDKSKLKTYGILGQEQYFFFDASNGVFNILNTNISVSYFDQNKNEEIKFMNNENNYTDLIMYTDAVSELFKGQTSNYIIGYGIGYKYNFLKDDNKLYFECILHLELGKPAYFTFKIVSNNYLNGEFRIYKNDSIDNVIITDLNEKIGKTFTWIIR